MACSRCSRSDVKIWDDGLCSFCGITESRSLAVVGLPYAIRGRMDRINPQKDTLRAIDLMAKTKPYLTRAEVQRWAADARRQPDRDYKYDPDSAGQGAPGRSVSPSEQAAARHAEGSMREFWGKCKSDYVHQRGKPKTEIQARNFQMVKTMGEA